MNGNHSLRIVVALAEDTLEARAEVSSAVEALNEMAAAENRTGGFEIVAWLEEGKDPGFFRESPHALIEEIRRAHSPDVIIGVFWRRFGVASSGSNPDPEGDLEQATQKWGETDHPAVMLFLCENSPPKLTDAEKQEQRAYIIQFRGLVKPGTFWRPYKKGSEFRRSPQKDGLREAVREYLLKLAGLGPGLELDLRGGEWKYINPRDLIKLRAELGEGLLLKSEDAVSYFDGEEPKWKYTVSESIPRRKVVGDITGRITEAAREKRLRVTLITGPGGEGKSTILQQVAVDIALNHEGVHVIWCQKPTAKLDEAFIRQMLVKEESFVVICDNAAMIAHDVYKVVEDLSDRPRVNVQFLLASQTIEWEWSEAPPDYSWTNKVGNRNFENVVINKLDLEDAERIVEKWAAAGPQGLGRLADVPADERAQYLVKLADGQETDTLDKGSLLGALLLARKDDATLQGQVETMLTRLEIRKAPGDRTLQDVFAYIAAIHADMAAKRAHTTRDRFSGHLSTTKPVILSKPILARALSCSLDELERLVLAPLSDEKATSGSEYFVFVRHHRIAEVAKRILAGRFPFRFDSRNRNGVYHEILRAAVALFIDEEISGDEMGPWNNLPRLYFEEGRLELALALGKVLVDAQQYDPIPVVSWAHIYRDANKEQEAANIFRDRYDTLLEHWKRRKADSSRKKGYLNKGYFSEWSVSEGQAGNHCFSAWLCGVALSDIFGERRAGDTPFMMLLSELSTVFKMLYGKAASARNPAFTDPSHAQTFLRACAATARLGLDKRVRESLKQKFDYSKSLRHLSAAQEFSAKHKVPGFADAKDALEALKEGINLAWNLRDKDEGELPPSLRPAPKLEFTKLSDCLRSEERPKDDDPTEVKKPAPKTTPRGY